MAHGDPVSYRLGLLTAADMSHYPILRFGDIPEIWVIDNPNEPALGLGECTIGSTDAAIGNAVARALGCRIRGLPLTRERIVATILK